MSLSNENISSPSSAKREEGGAQRRMGVAQQVKL
jgi:hypothetical protein